MARIGTSLLQRLPLLAAIGLAAVALRYQRPAPVDKSVDGVAALLGEAAGGEVASDGFVWESSGGALGDVLLGRNVLFLAAAEEGEPHDLYRARIRVTREGRPLEVRSVHNLTQTPLGDETMLVAQQQRVAYATRAFDVVQGATVLDLRGESFGDLSWQQKLLAQADNWLHRGSMAGFGRMEVVFGEPPPEARIELRGDKLLLALSLDEEAAALDLTDGTLNPGPKNSFRAATWTAPRNLKRFSHFSMDALRTLFGTRPADTFKALLFDARGRFLKARSEPQPAAAPAPVDPAASDPAAWPPASLQPLFEHPLEHEGEWQPPPVDWLPAMTGSVGKTAPYFYQTLIRPDPTLPFAQVRLVAIDTRQLRLHIEAGFEEPRPATGPRGRGRIPRDALPRVAGAFNGAFQTRHGRYGMAVDGRVLLPPQDDAATVAVDQWGFARVGTWRLGDEIPPHIVSLRQNLDPLIEAGVVNPRKRTQWGFPLDGGSFLTERSALCRTVHGQLIYGWGIELTAETLAKALLQAGCQDAMHLDMNPGHVGFAFMANGNDGVRAELLASEMSIAPDRFARASPKDFFYLTVRNAAPKVADAALAWTATAGAQPPPQWLPAIHHATVEKLGTEVTLHAIRPERFAWQIRPGERERAGKTASGPLTAAEQAQALLAVSLGVGARRDFRRGLVLDGVITLPIHNDEGMLKVGLDGSLLRIQRSVPDVAPEGDASELEMLAEAGELTSEARTLGPLRIRGAACQLPDGLLLLATAKFDSGEAPARALLGLGCRRIVDLNRGRQLRAFLHQAGKPPPIEAEYADTVLYGRAAPMPGNAKPLQE